MAIDWTAMFALSKPPLELVIRGTLIYWFLFVVFRTLLQRDIGAVGIADVLLLVIIADASQNAMAGDYRSVTDGIILISTILGWNFLFDYLAFKFPSIRRLLQPRELCLIRDGRINHRNLRREFMSVDELEAKLREQGIRELAEVEAAYMESDGAVSVIKKKAARGGADDQNGSSVNRPF